MPRHEHSELLQYKTARARMRAERVIADQISVSDMIIVGDAYGIDSLVTEEAIRQNKLRVVYAAQNGTWNRFTGNVWEGRGFWRDAGSFDTVPPEKRPLLRNTAMVGLMVHLRDRKFDVYALGFTIDTDPCRGTRHTWSLVAKAGIEGMLVGLCTAKDYE